MDDYFLASLTFALILTFGLSLLGLIPTKGLRGRASDAQFNQLSLLHILCLPVILAAVFGGLNLLYPSGDESDELSYCIACGTVATFWWYRIALSIGTHSQFPLVFMAYLISTVLFAFLSPLMILTFGVYAIDDFQPSPPVREATIGFVVSSALYCSCWISTHLFVAHCKSHDRG